jgi:hypothetical protein
VKFAAIYAIIVGSGMIAQWVLSYVTHQIPELKTEPVRIGFHILAEMLTASMLMMSGVGLLSSEDWGKNIFLIAMGMLFYTCVVSPGYFAQKGQWGWLGMFAVLILLGIVSILWVV